MGAYRAKRGAPTAEKAALSDLFQGPRLAKPLALLTTWQGLGVLPGPILASRLRVAFDFSFRQIYGVGAAIAALHLLVVYTKVKETLKREGPATLHLSSRNA